MTLREAVESLIPWADAYSDLAQRTNRPRREADEAYDAVLKGRLALVEDQIRNCDHVYRLIELGPEGTEDGAKYRCERCTSEDPEGDTTKDMGNSLRDAVSRCETLLSAVVDFIEKNPVSDYEVFYDEAMCDGNCLRDDCATQREELRLMLALGEVDDGAL